MLLNVSTFLHCRAFSVYSYTETIPCKVVHTMITNKHQRLRRIENKTNHVIWKYDNKLWNETKLESVVEKGTFLYNKPPPPGK